MYCGGAIIRQAVQLASGVNVPNLMALAKAAAEAQNHKEAYDYYTKVLEYNPRNSEAWFGKGECAGWMSTVAQLRIQEMIAACTNAVDYASASDRLIWVQRCCAAIAAVSTACYSISRKHVDDFYTVDSVWLPFIANCTSILAALKTGLAFYPYNRAALELTIRICADLLEGSATDFGTIWRRSFDIPLTLTTEYRAKLRTQFEEAAAQLYLIDPGYVKPPISVRG
jgi:tetratricopeptide (TPR) repeat protein